MNSNTSNSGDFWNQKDVEVRVCCGVSAVKFQRLLASEAKGFFPEPGIEDSFANEYPGVWNPVNL